MMTELYFFVMNSSFTELPSKVFNLFVGTEHKG